MGALMLPECCPVLPVRFLDEELVRRVRSVLWASADSQRDQRGSRDLIR